MECLWSKTSKSTFPIRWLKYSLVLISCVIRNSNEWQKRFQPHSYESPDNVCFFCAVCFQRKVRGRPFHHQPSKLRWFSNKFYKSILNPLDVLWIIITQRFIKFFNVDIIPETCQLTRHHQKRLELVLRSLFSNDNNKSEHNKHMSKRRSEHNERETLNQSRSAD